MADHNPERHDLAEAIWLHDDVSVLTVSGEMDAEYETILNVLDVLAEYPALGRQLHRVQSTARSHGGTGVVAGTVTVKADDLKLALDLLCECVEDFAPEECDAVVRLREAMEAE